MNIQRQLVLGFTIITTLGSLGRLPKTIGNPESGEKERQQETASIKSDERSDATPNGLHHSLVFVEALKLTNAGQFDLAISQMSPHLFEKNGGDQELIEGIRLNNLGTIYLIQSNCVSDEAQKRIIYARSEASFKEAQGLLQTHGEDLAVCLENQSLLAQKMGLSQKSLDLKRSATPFFGTFSNTRKL